MKNQNENSKYQEKSENLKIKRIIRYDEYCHSKIRTEREYCRGTYVKKNSIKIFNVKINEKTNK